MKRLALIVLLSALAGGGCAWLEAVTSRRGVDTRIVLAPRQRMEFSVTSRRNDAGQHIDEYRCPDEHVMVCVAHATRFECECWRNGL